MIEKKPGFTYFFSNAIKQNIAISQKTGTVYCEDGTQYSASEMNEIQKIYGELPLQVHIIKKNFGGTIISTQQ